MAHVEDPRNLVTHYQWNGFNEQTRLTSPDTGIADYTYDPAGNLKTRSAARNVVVSSDYDADNRIIETRYPATADTPAEVLSFRYDEVSGGPGAKGKLTSISDGSGSTQYVYDRDGRLTSRQQTVIVSGTPLTSTNTAHTYNANGQMQQTTLPSGAVVGYSYGADGRAISISVNGQVIARDIE